MSKKVPIVRHVGSVVIVYRMRKTYETLPWVDEEILHRVDGPAMIWRNGQEYWRQNNVLHRLDGPAVIYPDGTECFWINGMSFLGDIEAFLEYKKQHGLG